MHREFTSPMDRRTVIKTIAAGTLLQAPWVHAAGNTIKIGYVSPQTGPLAIFAEPDAFTLAEMKKTLAGGIKVGGKTYAVEFVVKDSQSNSNRAAEAASELPQRDMHGARQREGQEFRVLADVQQNRVFVRFRDVPRGKLH